MVGVSFSGQIPEITTHRIENGDQGIVTVTGCDETFAKGILKQIESTKGTTEGIIMISINGKNIRVTHEIETGAVLTESLPNYISN